MAHAAPAVLADTKKPRFDTPEAGSGYKAKAGLGQNPENPVACPRPIRLASEAGYHAYLESRWLSQLMRRLPFKWC